MHRESLISWMQIILGSLALFALFASQITEFAGLAWMIQLEYRYFIYRTSFHRKLQEER